MLRANRAWAHAGSGEADEAVRLLDLAHDELARASDPAPGWARFFDETDLCGLSGVVLTEPARTVDPSRTAAAIHSLTAAVSGYPEGMTRSRAFSLMALAANHLLDGDSDHAADVGARALALAGTIRSTRVADRLRPLRRPADRHPGNAPARALSAGIAAFTPPV